MSSCEATTACWRDPGERILAFLAPLSGNIGSYAADSMVRRCGPPTPPPARAADSDTLDPGTVRPSVPVYDKTVSRPVAASGRLCQTLAYKPGVICNAVV
jgi:hypothetical protein